MTHHISNPHPLRSGLDALVDNQSALDELRQRRIGVLCHSSSITSEFIHIVDALTECGLEVIRLFAPEHGVRGVEQAMDEVSEYQDSVTGIPVYSLYGTDENSLVPPPEAFDDLDHVLIDIQDIGIRYYTYAATAWQFAEIATDCDVPVWLLDRPNPLGNNVAGPVVEKGFDSFVGTLPVPTIHGLKLSEMFNFARQHGHDIDCRVFACEDEPDDGIATEKDMVWAMPSPNMPTLDTVRVYAGMCLLEATNISEARGTTRPFELFGAPWLNPTRLKEFLEELDLPGVRYRETAFKPTFDKYEGEVCRGLQLHVTDDSAYQSLATGVAVIHGVRTLHDSDFRWRETPYEFVSDRAAIDLLIGHNRVRMRMMENADFDAILAELKTPSDALTSIQQSRRNTVYE